MLGPILCGLVSQAPLLPKLRGHFAEFLNNASSVDLRILSSSTCVGFRYGHFLSHSGFSWQPLRILRYFFSLRFIRLISTVDLPAVFFLTSTSFSFPGSCFGSASPHLLLESGAGLSTCSPSTTLLSLALGPDLPRADQLYSGNLGYSAKRILTSFSLLIPAFSLPDAPPLLTVRLLRVSNAPLPIYLHIFPSFGAVFQPRTFSAQDLSTSELLRTL